MSSRSRQRAASKVVPALPLERLDPWRWRIPRDEERGMRVDGIVFADDRLMEGLHDDPALVQVANVATLPGIVGASLAMPDIHWGYGVPIGGVEAMRSDGGVVSPGGHRFRHQLRRPDPPERPLGR